jgi:DNA-binding phage protein
MEQTMRQEQNGAYLVSVEQCIKRAKGMADMGTASLQNISQILQFLKIEKLH